MGIDVNAYAIGDVPDDELDRANNFLTSRGVTGGWDEGQPPLTRDRWKPGRIEWNTLSRFYGEGYERGHWPEIHNGLVCIRAALPQCQVFYGPDTVDDGLLVTDEYLAKVWAHWLSDQGQRYRENRRRIK